MPGRLVHVALHLGVDPGGAMLAAFGSTYLQLSHPELHWSDRPGNTRAMSWAGRASSTYLLHMDTYYKCAVHQPPCYGHLAFGGFELGLSSIPVCSPLFWQTYTQTSRQIWLDINRCSFHAWPLLDWVLNVDYIGTALGKGGYEQVSHLDDRSCSTGLLGKWSFPIKKRVLSHGKKPPAVWVDRVKIGSFLWNKTKLPAWGLISALSWMYPFDYACSSLLKHFLSLTDFPMHLT